MHIHTVLLPLLLVLFQTIVTGSISLAEDSNCLVTECVDKPYGHKIADPSDCHGYLLCHGEMVFQQYCAPGFKFVEIIQDCIVGKCPPCRCPDDEETPIPPTTSPTPVTTLPTTPTISPTPPTDEPTPPDCSNEKHGKLLPDDTNCRFFWQCVNGQAVLRFCQLDMWWDRERFVCNFPSLVTNCPAKKP